MEKDSSPKKEVKVSLKYGLKFRQLEMQTKTEMPFLNYDIGRSLIQV